MSSKELRKGSEFFAIIFSYFSDSNKSKLVQCQLG